MGTRSKDGVLKLAFVKYTLICEISEISMARQKIRWALREF
jgi:hypothetical protein